MNVLRRILSTVLVVGVLVAVVAIDRQGGKKSAGASGGLVSLSGFPQEVSGSRISTSWFCPGAAAGDGLDAANVVLSNPGEVELTASITFLSGNIAESKTVVVPARSQLDVDVLRGQTVGVIVPVVEIIGPVGTVEQELIYAAGDVTSQCVTQTSDTWYFADGFTAQGSSQRIALINPYPETAVVNMAYTTSAGRRTPSVLQGIVLPARTVKSISMSDVGATNESKIAVQVIATTGQIVASRMQHYLGGGRLGYSTTVGAPTALGEWWFTSGRTGAQVTEQLVVFNPSNRAAQVNVSFFGAGITNGIPIDQPTEAALPSQAVDIPAGGIVTINTDSIADLPKGDHAMLVSALNSTRLVVEHVLSQQTNTSAFTAIVNGIPAGLLSEKWRIPSGLGKGARNAISILNTTAVDGTFTVSAVGPGGVRELPGFIDVPLGAASLVSLDVPDGVSDGEVIITASVPVAVQRRTTRGHGLIGFGIVGALPVRMK
jgi:hypothetical protein